MHFSSISTEEVYIVSFSNQMDCNCNCIDVQAVLPSIQIPVSLAILNTKSCYFNESCQTSSSSVGGKSSSYTSILALSMQINTYGNSTKGYTSLCQQILPLFTKDCRCCRSTQQATPWKSIFVRSL